MNTTYQPEHEETLDPENWDLARDLGHRMIDDLIDYWQTVRERPVWQRLPAEVKERFDEPLPEEPQGMQQAYQDFQDLVLPYPKGNIHPRFWGWVDGTGTVFGAFAEMLAAGMNSNLGVADHSAVHVERQVINWSKKMLGFPGAASGILTSGGSEANLIGLLVARNSVANADIGNYGVGNAEGRLTLYGSTESHSSLMKAADILGLGKDAFRKVPVNENFEVDVGALRAAIVRDREQGQVPFCIVGNAGTVNTGAIDPLAKLAELAQAEKLWFHIDGAFGALAALLPEYEEKIRGLRKADSVAFDFHKWLYVPYEAACVLVRDAEKHRNALAVSADYLNPQARGMAAGPEPLANYSIQLSRGFKALKVWLSLKEHGIDKYRRLIRQNIHQARYLGSLVEGSPKLELLAPVSLNIVCYRYNPGGFDEDELNRLNQTLLAELQERGIAAPSYTVINGRFAIRMANTNHRSRRKDFHHLVQASLAIGEAILCARPAEAAACK